MSAEKGISAANSSGRYPSASRFVWPRAINASSCAQKHSPYVAARPPASSSAVSSEKGRASSGLMGCMLSANCSSSARTVPLVYPSRPLPSSNERLLTRQLPSDSDLYTRRSSRCGAAWCVQLIVSIPNSRSSMSVHRRLGESSKICPSTVHRLCTAGSTASSKQSVGISYAVS